MNDLTGVYQVIFCMGKGVHRSNDHHPLAEMVLGTEFRGGLNIRLTEVRRGLTRKGGG